MVRVEQDNVPILGAPDLAARNLDVLGVASAGEVFALMDQKSIVALMNPIGNAPNQSGLWYKVRLLDGTCGWIFAEPQGRQGSSIARLFAVPNVKSPQPSKKQVQSQHATPSLGEALLKPLSDPPVSAAQRVVRGIGMATGGALAVLFLIATLVALVLTAGGGRRWGWWRERVRRTDLSPVSKRQA